MISGLTSTQCIMLVKRKVHSKLYVTVGNARDLLVYVTHVTRNRAELVLCSNILSDTRTARV